MKDALRRFSSHNQRTTRFYHLVKLFSPNFTLIYQNRLNYPFRNMKMTCRSGNVVFRRFLCIDIRQ